MLESKASKTRKRLQARTARILDLFSYKRKLYYINRKQPPPLYVPSSNDIRCAAVLARMNIGLREIEAKIDEYFRKLPIILQEDPSEITFSHFMKWVDKL